MPDDSPIPDAAPSANGAQSGAASDRSRRIRASSLVVGMALGAVGTVLVVIAALVFWLRDPTPQLTAAALDDAMQLWEAQGPKNYDLDVELSGKQPGRIHVEVRSGQVTHMTRDGIEPRQQRTWYYWSVPGQFDTIELELKKAADPAAGFQTPADSQVVQWALFDPQYGYPRRYRRSVMGTDLEIAWETVGFSPR